MKFISITKSINIRPDWASIGAKLKAGTPLDITGAVANTAAAVGILADDAERSTAEVAVVTEGSIDLAEITASYGDLTDDCIAAIKGISFIGSDGDPIVPSGGGGSGSGALNVTITKKGNTLNADKTYAEINEAYTAGTPVIVCLQRLNNSTSAVEDMFCAYEVTKASATSFKFNFIEVMSISAGMTDLTVTESGVTLSSGDALSYSSRDLLIAGA